MKYTLSAAANVTGKSKATIFRAIKSGRLSYESKEGNRYQIDAAELFRVFPRNVSENVQENKVEHGETVVKLGEMKVKFLEEKVAFLEKRIEEYQQQLEYERVEKQKLLAIVESQTKQITDQRKKRWWF